MKRGEDVIVKNVYCSSLVNVRTCSDQNHRYHLCFMSLNATGAQNQPSRIESIENWPSLAHVASVVRVRVWTDLFGNPTAEFRRLKESIRFRTPRPVPRIRESPPLRVCAIKDWLPSQEVCFSESTAASMCENSSRLTLFKVRSVYSLMKPWKYPKRIWTGMNLISCGW